MKKLLFFLLLLPILTCERNDMYKFSKGCIADAPEGYYLKFDGTLSNHVTIPHDSRLNFTNEFTVECWVKLDSIAVNQVILAKWGVVSVTNEYNLMFLFATQTIQFNVGYNAGSTATASAIVSILPGQLIHIAGVVSNGTAYLYINGSLAGTAAFSYPLTNNTYSLVLGAVDTAGNNSLNGALDEVRIWNKARNEEQIKYYNDCVLSGYDIGLISYYKFNEGSGSVINSSTINMLNGLLAGGTWNHW